MTINYVFIPINKSFKEKKKKKAVIQTKLKKKKKSICYHKGVFTVSQFDDKRNARQYQPTREQNDWLEVHAAWLL